VNRSRIARHSMAATLVALVSLAILATSPAVAIRYGDLDGEGHPFVGLMIAKGEDGQPLWRCSGTLLSSTLYLTAGHCVEEPHVHVVEMWFDAGPIPLDENYTAVADDGTGCDNVEVTGYPCWGDASGTPHQHPDYDPDAFFLRDLGVVVLDEPLVMAQYGELPELDQLDALRPSRHTTFTSLGYGLQWINPVQIEAERVRMVAYPQLHQINRGLAGDFSLILSNNANTGGLCFGDSGGPSFLGDSLVIAGVGSFVLNGNCAGTGGVFRVDRSWSLDWLHDDFGAHLP
jgi:hypothetical protein